MTARYKFGAWTDPRTVFGGKLIKPIAYGNEHRYTTKWGSPLMKKKKVDAHEYTTEAKNVDIETCRAMWLVKYGDEWVGSSELVEQDDLTWEIGNRLFWAGLLEHDTQMDQYKCKS